MCYHICMEPKKNKRVIGIDYSANFTGVVYDDIENDRTFWFTSNLIRDKNNINCTFIDKNIKTLEKVDLICDNIFGIINEIKPELVAIESPAFMASNQNSDFQDGYAIIKYVLRTMGINYILVPPISLKLFACDNTKADKLEVANGLKRVFKCNYDNETSKWDNLYDAHALYEIAKLCINQELLPDVDLSKQQVIYGLLKNDIKLKEIKKLRQKIKNKNFKSKEV